VQPLEDALVERQGLARDISVDNVTVDNTTVNCYIINTNNTVDDTTVNNYIMINDIKVGDTVVNGTTVDDITVNCITADAVTLNGVTAVDRRVRDMTTSRGGRLGHNTVFMCVTDIRRRDDVGVEEQWRHFRLESIL
jgi:hypothetical protein